MGGRSEVSEQSQGPGWWLASDGRWYPPASPPPPPGAATAERSTKEKVGIGAAGALLVGSFLPWASVGPFTVSGTDGDGTITLVLAAIAGALLWGRKSVKIVLALFVLSLLVTGYDLGNISNVAGEGDNTFFEVEVEVGVGLLLAFLGALTGTVATGLRLRKPQPTAS